MKHACVAVLLAALLPLGAASSARQSSISIEIEDFAGSAKVSGGRTSRQDMRGFGAGWSGSAQLFWAAPPPVEAPIRNWPNLSLSFVAPAAQTYEVILHYTSAPDFATFRVFLDAQPRADIDAYSPAVAPASRSLGRHNLTAGRHELMVTVFGKAPASTGFAVGLDRLELRPPRGLVPDLSGISRPPGGAAPQQPSQPTVPSLALLNFANVNSITMEWTAKGGTERNLDGPNPTAHLVWESPGAKKFAWRWQVALQPFSGPVSLSPPGLVAQEQVSAPAFKIDLATFPPLKGMSTQTVREPRIDFYIRLVATDGGQPVGAASNVVVAHYLVGSDQSTEIVRDAFKRDHDKKVLDAAIAALSTLYKVEILSFKPAMFADPNRWGCVFIVKNDHAFTMGHRLAGYPPGEHCGRSYKGQGHTLTPWDYITGWAKAYEVVSQFYDEAKAWTASQFANTLPCGMLGKAADECKKYGEQLAGTAINVGLVAAGVPPSLPDLNAAAKGKAVEAGVSFSCATIESNGGQCSPELRAALAKAYGAGLNKLEKDLNRTTKEPGCDNTALAHENGREPLPCFGDYPEVEFRPADDAVYLPPLVTVRVTRTARGLPNLENADIEIHADLRLDNRFSGQIESYYQPVPPTDLSAELFVPAALTLPSLALGQSATVTLTMGGIKQYTFYTTDKGRAPHNGWCALYNGGSGPLRANVRCRGSKGNWVSCGIGASTTVQTPKDGKCNIG